MKVPVSSRNFMRNGMCMAWPTEIMTSLSETVSFFVLLLCQGYVLVFKTGLSVKFIISKRREVFS